MQTPLRHQRPSLVETISRPVVYVLRYLFFVLIFFLLLSIAAGLFMPGQEFGRYALQMESGHSCEDLQRELAPFNLNQVDFSVEAAAAEEFAAAASGSSVCWLELAGVSADGVSAESAPVYRAARERAGAVLAEQRYYQPRHGERETWLVWLLALLLAAIVFALRLRSQQKATQAN